jgi:hypothetical protein
MKKKLDTTSILNELRGESVFFPTKNGKPAPDQAGTPKEQITKEELLPLSPSLPSKKVHHDTVIPRYHDTKHDTTISRHHDTMKPSSEEELLEAVRKAVKQVGKEAATQRLTLEEKQALADIEYSYKRQGIKTSGNEIMRIATNYIVKDYLKNGENSILAKIIQRLNS